MDADLLASSLAAWYKDKVIPPGCKDFSKVPHRPKVSGCAESNKMNTFTKFD
jgi:hypothetical protein